MFVGRPIDNTAIYLLDENHHPVVSGEVGELYVSGLNIAQGYVRGRDPHRFLPNPLTVDPRKWYSSNMLLHLKTYQLIGSHIRIKNSEISYLEFHLNLFNKL